MPGSRNPRLPEARVSSLGDHRLRRRLYYLFKPYDHVIRGGTDGSRLTELGLPTPNLFCGEHNAHGPLEWVAVQDMESAVTACAHLVELWQRKG